MVHSGGPPSMASLGENPAQPSNPLSYLIAASPATAGARATQAPLWSNDHPGPFSGGSWRFGRHAKQPVAPASNAFPARWTVPLPSNDGPRPLLFSAQQRPAAPRRVLQPSSHVAGNGTGALRLLPQGGARFLSRTWPAAPNGGMAVAPPQAPVNRYLATSWTALSPVVPRQPPCVRTGGSAFPARGGSGRAGAAPVPDKSFEEFLLERGVLGGPISVAPPPNTLPGLGGAVGLSRVELAGPVSGAAGRHGWLALAAGLGAALRREQMGLGAGTLRITEASGAGAVRGRGRAAADEAKERRMMRMARMREAAAARARAHALAAARGDGHQEAGGI